MIYEVNRLLSSFKNSNKILEACQFVPVYDVLFINLVQTSILPLSMLNSELLALPPTHGSSRTAPPQHSATHFIQLSQVSPSPSLYNRFQLQQDGHASSWPRNKSQKPNSHYFSVSWSGPMWEYVCNVYDYCRLGVSKACFFSA